jgi:putative flavoprotein involved in K+ transport
MPFGGDPDRYPHRDEVVDYLARYAVRIDVDIRTRHRVKAVAADGDGFRVTTTHGEVFGARAVVAATGGFGRPHRPELPGLDRFPGSVVHVADYRRPHGYEGQRVVVVGAGNSAVQVAAELATVARTTLASRAPVTFSAQRPFGRDLHFWLTVTGLDIAPVGRLLPKHFTTPVLDTGVYRAAVAAGLPERRPLFTGIDGSTVVWSDGTRETVDAIVLATGYRPDLGYRPQRHHRRHPDATGPAGHRPRPHPAVRPPHRRPRPGHAV